MKAILLRTGSLPVYSSSFIPGSPRISLPIHDSVSGEKSNAASPRISLHLDVNPRNIRRASSESDMILSVSNVSGGLESLSGAGSQSFPVKILEEEYVSDSDEIVLGGIGSLMLTERGFDRRNYAGEWPVEELGFPSGGIGKGRMSVGGSGSDDFGFSSRSADRNQMGTYYQEMLKSNPTNSLLLRNYAKFLHEVEGDTVKAEEFYGRAILASPGDGEVLSLYGKLIWETHGDEDRAQSYFDQAVHASPDDCMVLGSYAQFLWEAEEEEEEEVVMESEVEVSAEMVEAF